MRKSRGMGLVEVIVAGAVLALIAVGISQLVNSSLKGARNLQNKSDLDSLTTTLKLILGEPALCASSLFNDRSPPGPIKFNPVAPPAAADQLHSIRRGATSFVELGQVFPTYRITRLEITEIDPAARLPDGPTRTRYLTNLRLEATKSEGSLGAPTTTQNFTLWVTADNTTHVVSSCTASSQGTSQLVTADLTLQKMFVPGCDGASVPPNECYCGGLETIHRANTATANWSGTPYGHGMAAAGGGTGPLGSTMGGDPFNRERPRAWVGEAECPSGYVAGVAGADCGPIAGSGKLENITPLSPTRVKVGCCVYTSDAIANGAVAPNALKLVCYKNS